MQPFLRNRRVLYRWLLAALTELAVAVPWMLLSYSLLGGERWPDALPSTGLLLVTYLAAGAWEVGAKLPAGVAARARLIAMSVGMAVVYTTAFYAAPPELTGPSLLKMNVAVAILPVTAYLWFQGARNAAEGLSYGFVFDRFAWQCGILVAGVLALIPAGAFRDDRVQVLLFWSVLLVFMAGLTLLVVTRERALRLDQHKLGESGGEGGSSRLLTGLVASLLLLTLGASRILSVDRLNAIVGVFKAVLGAVLGWLTDVAMLIVYRLVLIFIAVFGPLAKAIMGILQRGGLLQLDPGESPFDPAKFAEPAAIERIVPYVQMVLVLMGVLLVGLVLYRMSRSIRQQLPDDEEERISLGFWSSMIADIRSAFAGLPGSGEAAGAADERLDPRSPRALFRRLQTWGDRRGRPREAAETPNTYRGALAEQHPALEGAVDLVTAVYNQARYGAEPPRPEQVERAVSAIGQVEAARTDTQRQ